MIESTILNKHNLIETAIQLLTSIKENRFSQWSGLKSMTQPLPKNTRGRSGSYQIYYKNKLVYFGISNSNEKGKTNGSGYGINSRLQPKMTILQRHHNNPERILTLKESCMKKAVELGYDMRPENWSYRYWLLPKHIPPVLESIAIPLLQAEGLCELNTRS